MTPRELRKIRRIVGENWPLASIIAVLAAGSIWSFKTLNGIRQAGELAGLADMQNLMFSLLVAGAGVVMAAASALALDAVAARVKPFFPPPDPQDVGYEMPPFPNTRAQLQFVVGESHKRPAGYSPEPEWFSIPTLGLYTGCAVVGATGAAKTAGIARPFLAQMLEFAADDHHRRCGGLIMDYKASLVQPAIEAATEAGRTQDLMIVGPARDYKWNPVHSPELEPRVIAGRLMAVLENMSGQSNTGDTAWIAAGAGNVIEHSIGLLRLAAGYVTIADLHDFVSGLESAVACPPDGSSSAEAAVAYLKPFRELFTSGQHDPGEVTEFDWHCAYFSREYASQDAKFRAIYISEITRVTQYFADPRYRERFSPREADINFAGFSDAINTGKLVVLDANSDLYGALATALGIFLKLDFQRAMLARPVRHRDNPNYNFARQMLWLVDEYQEFVSTGGQGDPQFFALSRESKAVCLVATQSRASLVQRIGEDRTKVLLASLRTKIFLALADPGDCKYAAEICGEDWSQVENINISESVQGAGLSGAGKLVGSSSTVAESRSLSSQKVNRFEPVQFRDLPTFQAIVSGFDGRSALPPERVLLKPYFKPRDLSYREFMEGF